VSAEASK